MIANTSSSSSPTTVHAQTRALLGSLGLLPPTPDAAKGAVARTVRALDRAGGGLRAEWSESLSGLEGMVYKQHVLGRDEIGAALEHVCAKIKVQKSLSEQTESVWDGERDIKMENVPSHLAFLLALSNPPTPETKEQAEHILAGARTRPRTQEERDRDLWNEIFASEKADEESDPWEEPDYGSDDSDRGSIYEPDSSVDDEVPPPSDPASGAALAPDLVSSSWKAEEEPYWRTEPYKPVLVDGDSGLDCDLSGWNQVIEAPSLPRLLESVSLREAGIEMPERRSYLSESDAIREVLFCLMGRPGELFRVNHGSWCEPNPACVVQHLSPGALNALLAEFAAISNTVLRLQGFASDVFCSSRSPTEGVWRCLTLEAFAEAVEVAVYDFFRWCVDREEELLTPPSSTAHTDAQSRPVHTLLSLADQVVARSETLDALHNLVCSLPSPFSSTRPSTLALEMLDALFRTISTSRSIERAALADELEAVFLRAAQPLWGMLGRWLREGVGATDETSVSAEFFIVRKEDPIARAGGDGDAWRSAFSVRQTNEGDLAVPVFLRGVERDILAAGKAVGLLKALGRDRGLSSEPLLQGSEPWPSIHEVLGRQSFLPPSVIKLPPPAPFPRLVEPHPPPTRASPLASSLPPALARSALPSIFDPTFDSEGDLPLAAATPSSITQSLTDHLDPQLQGLQYQLYRVLMEDCGLIGHLAAIEGLFWMRRGEVLGEWAEEIWSRMDSGRPWGDAHALDLSFSELVEISSDLWIDPTLVRFRSKLGTRVLKSSSARSVKLLESLSADYAIPFPLSFVFTPETQVIRSRVFVLLLQIRRARNVTSRLSLIQRDEWQSVKDGTETKAFYALRKKLGWIVSVLEDYIMTTVLHVESERFRAALATVVSLDAMIPLHEHHIARIRDLCLLSERTSALSKSITSILDLCVLFSDVFAAFTSDAGLFDLSRRSILPPRPAPAPRRKSKRSWRSRKLRGDDESDDDGDDGADETMAGGGGWSEGESEGGGSRSWTQAVSFVEETFLSRVERMSVELGSQIRFLYLGIDTLAKTSAASPATVGEENVAAVLGGGLQETYGVLAFLLEAWKG